MAGSHEAECPHCGAEVAYEEWVEVESDEGAIRCPSCSEVSAVDDVYPEAG